MSLITILVAGALLSIAWRVLDVAHPDRAALAFIALIAHYAGEHANDGRTSMSPTATQPAEDSPTDFVWGCRDGTGGYGGQNLLGLAVMQVRGELVADVHARVSALAPSR